MPLYTYDAPFISLPSATWWRFLFSCYFSPCEVQMRLRGLFNSCVQPPALQILGFQALKNAAVDTLGSVIINKVNPTLPLDLASAYFEDSCNYSSPLKASFFWQGKNLTSNLFISKVD